MDELSQLKEIYQKTEPSAHLRRYGWYDLEKRLTPIPLRQRHFEFLFLGILLAIAVTLGFTRIVKASYPGKTLYPLKKLSEDVVVNITGNETIRVDNRANEILDLAKDEKKDSELLKETVDDYRSTVVEVKREVESTSGDKQTSFNQKLEEHESSFHEAAQENPSASDELEKAEEAAKEGHEIQHEEEGGD